MIDTHAHVHDKAFDADRGGMLVRARDRGITEIITVGCDLADSERALTAATEYGLFASVGIHPHEAKDAPDDIAGAFAPFLRNPRVIAVGETGLDYYYAHSPKEAQIACMRAQVRVAKAHALPVIFHHRDAYDDFVAVLRDEFSAGMRGVVHCFTGDAAQARTYVEEFGLKLGIGGVMTFKTAQPIRDAILAVGLEACILETDCPYLAPVPHRGKRNEPAFMADTAAALASLSGRSLNEVAATTDANARALFTFSENP